MNAPTKITAAESAPHVYAAIAGVMSDIAKEGIAKNARNTQQGYNFRGIDDVYNALAPILARHQLCIVPRVLNREVTERTTIKGGAIFYVACQVEFTLISAEDGSTITATTFGEAMDSADKATNKAMSAAYKYMAMQTFCIPTQGDNDADATTHEVAGKGAITADQAQVLRDLIKETGAPEKPILDYCRVARIEEIPAAGFEAIKAKLEARKQPKTEKEPA